MLNTVGSCGYAKKLGKYKFSETLCASLEDCEDWYNHCKEHNMVFCNGTYGTLVHKNFSKYFKLSTMSTRKVPKILGVDKFAPHNPSKVMDHVNIFYWRDDSSMKMITTSPYSYFKPSMFDGIEDSEYSVYAIHPNLLDYYAFVCRDYKNKHPFGDISYAFIKPDDVWRMDEVLCDGIKDIFKSFVLVHE